VARPRRRLSDQARRELLTRQGNLTALSRHPNWPDMEAEIERKAQRIEKHLLARFAQRAPIDQREIDYLRGFTDGMRWMGLVPVRAESSLERFLQEQQGVRLEGAEV